MKRKGKGAERRVVLLLHNIRSAHNVGSIFRTADASGAERILLSGYCPLPVDRFGGVQKEIAKTALGAERYILWEYAKTPNGFIKKMKADGWRIVGVEQDARAKSFRELKCGKKTLFLLGNEVKGLSGALRDQCDELVEIPMRGKKESLNVSVVAGIVLYAAFQ